MENESVGNSFSSDSVFKGSVVEIRMGTDRFLPIGTRCPKPLTKCQEPGNKMKSGAWQLDPRLQDLCDCSQVT